MTSRDADPNPPQQRLSRLGLYLPVSLLAMVALAWCGFWFYAARTTEQAISEFKTAEARQGRTWTCADQSVGGFPFRIELQCASLQLDASPDGRAARLKTGPVHAATQVYSPTLILAEVDGPVVSETEGVTTTATFENMRVSVRFANRLERLSLVAARPQVTVAPSGVQPIVSGGKTAEAHLRYDPERPAADRAVDVAIQLAEWDDPILNGLIGSNEKLDLALSGVATQVSDLAPQGWRNTLESWRSAGGVFNLENGKLAKGALQVEAKGALNLDTDRRLAGKLDLSATGLQPLLAKFGLSGGLNQLMGALLVRKDGAPIQWPVQMRDGRVQLGPLRTGSVLKPLY